MYVQGLPATKWSFGLVVSTSAPGACRASGGAPGHIGICLCPGDGSHACARALRPQDANMTRNAATNGFMSSLPPGESVGRGSPRVSQELVETIPLRGFPCPLLSSFQIPSICEPSCRTIDEHT